MSQAPCRPEKDLEREKGKDAPSKRDEPVCEKGRAKREKSWKEVEQTLTFPLEPE